MKKLLAFGLCLLTQIIFSQTFTKRDSLQGGLPFERTCFDVQKYIIDVSVDAENKSISGLTTISFKVVENTKRIQLDLFENMKIDSIVNFNENNSKLLDRKSTRLNSSHVKISYAVF